MKKYNLICLVGTRPEAIKMAPVILELRHNAVFNVDVILSGQHKEIASQALELFNISDFMFLEQSHTKYDLDSQASGLLTSISEHFKNKKTDLVLVHGDTTTGFIGALAAFYLKIPVAHVEAGLRSWDMDNPFPEEMNRCMIDNLASICFAPTPLARKNLLKENVGHEKTVITGNTIVDAINIIKKGLLPLSSLSLLNNVNIDNKRIILVTMHRRENWGKKMRGLCEAIKRLAQKYSDVVFILPVHPNPQVRGIVMPMLSECPGVVLTEALDYHTLLILLKYSYLTLTDSGGIQEEAPSFQTPALVLRKVTERPEAVDAGYAMIINTDPETVIRRTSELLENQALYQTMIANSNPFGDGLSSGRINQSVMNYFNNAPLNTDIN